MGIDSVWNSNLEIAIRGLNLELDSELGLGVVNLSAPMNV